MIPYTTQIPGGTPTQVQFVQPTSVSIAWPDKTGGTVQKKPQKLSILKKLFG